MGWKLFTWIRTVVVMIESLHRDGGQWVLYAFDQMCLVVGAHDWGWMVSVPLKTQ